MIVILLLAVIVGQPVKGCPTSTGENINSMICSKMGFLGL
jgi:hypothetical protein